MCCRQPPTQIRQPNPAASYQIRPRASSESGTPLLGWGRFVASLLELLPPNRHQTDSFAWKACWPRPETRLADQREPRLWSL
jgi:hypothetical protein